MKIKILLLLALFSFKTMASQGGDDAGNGGLSYLVRSPVNQYTCIMFGEFPSYGGVNRSDYAKVFGYYLEENVPDPINYNPSYVCHDYLLYGVQDSYLYPRLDLIENRFTVYSRFDARFDSASENLLVIDTIISERMKKEYGQDSRGPYFSASSVNGSYGMLVKPIQDRFTNKVVCPTSEYLSLSPLIKIITDYTGDTEPLYLGQVENQMIRNYSQNGPKIVNAAIKITESEMLKNGFYMKNGKKIRVEYPEVIETGTVFFYWPFSDIEDPLVQGSRLAVRVVFPDANANTKKLGCVFKQEK